MGNPKSVRRNFKALEARRFQATKLFDEGVSQAEVARRIGVSRESTRRWHNAWDGRGTDALEQAGRAGRKPRLRSAQIKELRQRLKEGPEILGYGSGLWTIGRVATLIEKQTGLTFHYGHVWRIWRALGRMSPVGSKGTLSGQNGVPFSPSADTYRPCCPARANARERWARCALSWD